MRQRSARLRYLLVGILLILLFVWAAAGLIERGRPAISGRFPLPEAIAVPAPAPLHITFDRAMNRSSVESALQTEPPSTGRFSWEGSTLTYQPDPPWPRGQLITVTLSTEARTTGGIPLSGPAVWTFKTAPTLLAYLWPADGPADLYALDPQGGDVVRFTELPGGVLDFSLAPDGLSLLLSAGNPEGGADIALFDLVDRTVTILYACESDLCRNPQYHPDGRRIVFEEETAQQVFLLDSDGGSPAARVGPGRFPTWSGEGMLLYYDPVQAAYVAYNPDSGGRTAYPNDAGEPAVWEPEGGSFLAADILEIGESALSGHLMDYLLFGSEPVDRTADPDADDGSPVYSPEGDWIAFARRYQDPERWTPGRQLWLMPAGGGEAEPLSDAALYNHTAFAWRPDGRQLAYLRSNQADLNEPPEIWLIDLESRSRLRLMINGFAPVWLP